MPKKPPAPSDLADKFMLRMPDGLRDRIALAAKRNGRSMNAEIIHVLETHYPPESSVDEILESLTDLLNDAVKHPDARNVKTLIETLQELREHLAKSAEDEAEPR